MDGNKIRTILADTPNFVGVYARDTLPYNIKKKPFGLVVNTDESDKPGEHWIAFYFDSDGIGEYFDSYGLPPLYEEFYDYLNEYSSGGHFHNKVTLQCTTCITCGHYCILFLLTRA